MNVVSTPAAVPDAGSLSSLKQPSIADSAAVKQTRASFSLDDVKRAVAALKDRGIDKPFAIEVAEYLDIPVGRLRAWVARHRKAGCSWAKLGITLQGVGSSKERDWLKEFLVSCPSDDHRKLAIFTVLDLFDRGVLNRTQAVCLSVAFSTGQTLFIRLDTPVGHALGILPRSVFYEIRGARVKEHKSPGLFDYVDQEFERRLGAEQSAHATGPYAVMREALQSIRAAQVKSRCFSYFAEHGGLSKKEWSLIEQEVLKVPDSSSINTMGLAPVERRVLEELVTRKLAGANFRLPIIARDLDRHLSVIQYSLHGRKENIGGIEKVIASAAPDIDKHALRREFGELTRNPACPREILLHLQALIAEAPNRDPDSSLNSTERKVALELIRRRACGEPHQDRDLAKALSLSQSSVSCSLRGRDSNSGAFEHIDSFLAKNKKIRQLCDRALQNQSLGARSIGALMAKLPLGSQRRDEIASFMTHLAMTIPNKNVVWAHRTAGASVANYMLDDLERKRLIYTVFFGAYPNMHQVGKNLASIVGNRRICSITPSVLFDHFHGQVELAKPKPGAVKLFRDALRRRKDGALFGADSEELKSRLAALAHHPRLLHASKLAGIRNPTECAAAAVQVIERR